MKVMIATPVLLVGGTEVQVLSTVRVLAAAGYTVVVCCYYEFDERIVKLMKSAGAEVVLLRLDRSRGSYVLGDMLVLMRALVAIFRRYQPDIAHVQYLAPGFLPILAARLARVKVVFSTVHIAGSTAFDQRHKFLLRIAAKLCNAFLCVSRGVEEFWFGTSEVLRPGGLHGRKHWTIYNGVDTDAIKKATVSVDRARIRSELEISSENVIGIVGRLVLQKGHVVLLDAMVEIIRHFPNVVLIVVGDGAENTGLQNRARQLGIDGHIRWLGAMVHNEVVELYSVMNLVAMPSLFEGFGLTAVEAMAAGKPVVGSKVDGLEEIIDHGVTGYLVPAGDSATLAGAICDLLANPAKARRMGESGQVRAERLFSLDRFAESVLYAYQTFGGHSPPESLRRRRD
jgi:glycosyltransferase involved in cell wall biosynthesis